MRDARIWYLKFFDASSGNLRLALHRKLHPSATYNSIPKPNEPSSFGFTEFKPGFEVLFSCHSFVGESL
jgi:hypothetical protein